MKQSLEERLVDISTLDLIDCLLHRMDSGVIIGHRAEEDGQNTFWEYSGEPSYIYGLLQQMSYKLLKDNLEDDNGDKI